MKIDHKLFEKGATVGVALSGGRDSASLFHYLLTNKDILGIKLVAVNIEHGIREESKRESLLLKEHCEKLGIPIKVYTVDAISYARENKKTIEQSARILRYECFLDAVKSGFCSVIATAHHEGDDVETVLMRIFRGTGARGISGISECRDYIVRPMLNVKRSEIDEYCVKNNIKYFEDSTNQDQAYTRNFIRHSVIPLIEQKYPNVQGAIIRLSQNAQIDEEHFERLTKDKVEFDGKTSFVKCEDLTDLAVAFRLIIKAFSMLGVNADVEKRHIDLLLELAKSQNGTILDMPYMVKAVKEYDKIAFTKQNVSEKKEYLFQGENLTFEIDGNQYEIKEVTSRQGLCVDGEAILGATIRRRRKGDIFKRFGGGSKSLGDYFTDIKYPVRLRDNAIVLARDNEILAVFGVEISEKVKITDKTQKIFKLHGGEDVFRRI